MQSNCVTSGKLLTSLSFILAPHLKNGNHIIYSAGLLGSLCWRGESYSMVRPSLAVQRTRMIIDNTDSGYVPGAYLSTYDWFNPHPTRRGRRCAASATATSFYRSIQKPSYLGQWAQGGAWSLAPQYSLYSWLRATFSWSLCLILLHKHRGLDPRGGIL